MQFIKPRQSISQLIKGSLNRVRGLEYPIYVYYKWVLNQAFFNHICIVYLCPIDLVAREEAPPSAQMRRNMLMSVHGFRYLLKPYNIIIGQAIIIISPSTRSHWIDWHELRL